MGNKLFKESKGLILEIDALTALANDGKQNDNFTDTVLRVRDVYLKLFKRSTSNYEQSTSALAYIKFLKLSNTKVHPQVKVLLRDLVTAIGSESIINFKNYQLVSMASELAYADIDFTINPNTSLLNGTDELYVLFSKYSLSEMIWLLAAVKNVCVDNYDKN